MGKWSIREVLIYFSIGMAAIVLASIGQGNSIRQWAQVARDKGEPESLQPGQIVFMVKLLAILGGLLLLRGIFL